MTNPLAVTFDIDDNWPTPNHCRRIADALDAITPAKYGDILRAYADAEDARMAEHGPYAVASRKKDDCHCHLCRLRANGSSR